MYACNSVRCIILISFQVTGMDSSNLKSRCERFPTPISFIILVSQCGIFVPFVLASHIQSQYWFNTDCPLSVAPDMKYSPKAIASTIAVPPVVTFPPPSQPLIIKASIKSVSVQHCSSAEPDSCFVNETCKRARGRERLPRCHRFDISFDASQCTSTSKTSGSNRALTGG